MKYHCVLHMVEVVESQCANYSVLTWVSKNDIKQKDHSWLYCSCNHAECLFCMNKDHRSICLPVPIPILWYSQLNISLTCFKIYHIHISMYIYIYASWQFNCMLNMPTYIIQYIFADSISLCLGVWGYAGIIICFRDAPFDFMGGGLVKNFQSFFFSLKGK